MTEWLSTNSQENMRRLGNLGRTRGEVVATLTLVAAEEVGGPDGLAHTISGGKASNTPLVQFIVQFKTLW